MKKLFVHIPKTGGTSIRTLLKDDWNRSWPFGHDPFFELQRMNDIGDDVFSFAVVRNPFDRTYSYYQHYKIQNGVDISFYDFLNLIRTNQATNKTPMIVFDQSFYIFDLYGKCSISKIYRFENLEELEYDLNIKIPRLNTGNYTRHDYMRDYTEDNINLVKHIFSRDFTNLKY